MMPKTPKPSPLTYGIFAVFFFAWCAVAGYLLLGGDTDPVTRLVFAGCGVSGVFAALRGGLANYRLNINRNTFRVPVWGRVVLVLFALVAGGLWFAVRSVNSFYADDFTSYPMREQVVALQEYAEKHEGYLPPDMRSETVTRYLGLRFRTPHPEKRGEPYVWNNRLSGRKIAAFKTPEKVVAVYSQPISKRGDRVVIFLDRHSRYHVYPKELQQMLRESDAEIAKAKHAANTVH